MIVTITIQKLPHTQSWYFHAIPFLLGWTWRTPPSNLANLAGRLAAIAVPMAAAEYAFLTFPATPASSTVLQAVHLYVLVQIRPLSPIDENESDDDEGKETKIDTPIASTPMLRKPKQS